MLLCQLLLPAVILAAPPQDGGRIDGVVVNGLTNLPQAGVEVVLRAGEAGAFMPIDQATTNAQGRFAFAGLPLDPAIVFLAGANHQGVHYPGSRAPLRPGAEAARIRLTVYDAVTAPSPLVIDQQHIDVAIEPGAMQVTETVVVGNPTKTSYVGQAQGEMPPVTLKLAIPPGFERVTFYDEFHGRRFYVVEGYVATDIPWPPGQRTLKYTYRLPVEEREKLLERVVDLPCSRFRLSVRGEGAQALSCNLPKAVSDDASATVFESAGKALPAGHRVQLQLGGLPTPWMTYGKWGAIGLLGALILGTVWRRGRHGSARKATEQQRGHEEETLARDRPASKQRRKQRQAKRAA